MDNKTMTTITLCKTIFGSVSLAVTKIVPDNNKHCHYSMKIPKCGQRTQLNIETLQFGMLPIEKLSSIQETQKILLLGISQPNKDYTSELLSIHSRKYASIIRYKGY